MNAQNSSKPGQSYIDLYYDIHHSSKKGWLSTTAKANYERLVDLKEKKLREKKQANTADGEGPTLMTDDKMATQGNYAAPPPPQNIEFTRRFDAMLAKHELLKAQVLQLRAEHEEIKAEHEEIKAEHKEIKEQFRTLQDQVRNFMVSPTAGITDPDPT